MASPAEILRPERSTAAQAAVAVLCVLGLFQLGTLAWWAWQKASATAPQTAAQAAPSALPTAAQALSAALRAAPPASTSSLPPLPSLPGAAQVNAAAAALPPLPTLGGSAPLTSAATPQENQIGRISPISPIPSSPAAPAPQSPARPTTPTTPTTGNAEADALLDMAAQLRDAGEATSALATLDRADLMLPDHPVVMRERAKALGKAGQTTQAQALWKRLEAMGPQAGAESTGSAASASSAPSSALDQAFGGSPTSKGLLTLGPCLAERDLSVPTGERVMLKVPVVATQPGVKIDPYQFKLDVFFYDKVDETRIEPTQCDPPTTQKDDPLDWTTGTENFLVTYHMPELTPQDVANIGHRKYHGYVVKLYYQGQLLGSAASPRELLTQAPEAAQPSAPPESLLPLPR